MLAVRSAMDALHHSNSFSSERDSLMRQPSAEDLDAAHQLVSSALGERHVSHTSHDNHVNTTTQNVSAGQDSSRPAASEPQLSSGETVEQREDGSTLGQVCRYVHSNSSYRLGIKTLLFNLVTDVALVTVEPPRHRYGDGLPQVIPYAMPVVSISRLATLLDLPIRDFRTPPLRVTPHAKEPQRPLVLRLFRTKPKPNLLTSHIGYLSTPPGPVQAEESVTGPEELKDAEGVQHTTTGSLGAVWPRPLLTSHLKMERVMCKAMLGQALPGLRRSRRLNLRLPLSMLLWWLHVRTVEPQ